MIDLKPLHPRSRWARSGLLGTVALLVALAAACGSGSGPKASPTTIPPSSSSVVHSGTVWLCRPGTTGDPCSRDEAANVVASTGATTTQGAPPGGQPAFDCFYVYGTVSAESTLNADLQIQAAEVGVAVDQASRFSSVCRVWAPIYRQVTLQALLTGHAIDPAVLATAYQSLASAWQDYLTHYNDGRPIIFIGHSQGAAMLTMLLRNQVDNDPQLRARLVSAIVLGGNVTVPVGKDVGGTFAHIPACRSSTETGCVIAYSTFSTPPPADSLFGIPGQGVSLQSGQNARAGLQVLCVNPGAIGASGRVQLHPYFRVPAAGGATASNPPWVTYPGLYLARCMTGGGAAWLQIDTSNIPGDHRPKVKEDLGPTWGLHVNDANLALGDLVTDVHQEETAYRAS
jgi:hypothetical protein